MMSMPNCSRRPPPPALAAVLALALACAPVRASPPETDALCSGTGGPCVYVGQTTSPARPGIAGADWEAFLAIVEATLEDLAVPPAERTKLLNWLNESVRPNAVDRR